MPDLGVVMPRNQTTDIAGLHVAGPDEFWGPFFDPRSALASIDCSKASLVLCHNPDAMDVPVWNGYRGWILAGHTHGGQCKPPFFNAPVVPFANKNDTEGAYDLGDGGMMYINRGLGHRHRIRFNARPEITVFELEQATDG